MLIYWAEAYKLIKKNRGSLVVASREIGPEFNAVKTKFIVMSRDQTAGQVHKIKTDKSSFEEVQEIKILEH
jgi:hypothetical protein